MKHNFKGDNSDKFCTSEEPKNSCVAWFKLAELITRKEREKALSLYRLLSHSFDDRAYALQVEGDILWSLEDGQALEKYAQAAYLYKKEKNIVAATGVYEHLLILKPGDYDYLSKIIILYILLSWVDKFEEKYSVLLEFFKNEEIKVEQILDLTKKIIDFLTGVERVEEDVQDLISSKDLSKEFSWVLSSLAKILKARDLDLYGDIKNYCLELNLNFNA